MFYNVENLFDTFNDSLKNDEEFLPYGEKHWNNEKFEKKINGIYKIIMNVGVWEPPALIGFCEIENRYVLEELINKTPLSKFDYRIIHQESPDIRGIDVALLYRKEIFVPDFFKAVKINFNEGRKKTRDILYVRGKLLDSGIVHIFINHWPSRYGGQISSEPDRIFLATKLRSLTDSLFEIYEDPNIIITGDFNDGPESESLITTLDAKIDFSNILKKNLYNLSSGINKRNTTGTYKYQGRWETFDQFILSGNMFDVNNNISSTLNGYNIFAEDYLFEEDKSYLGRRPFRTYLGPVYHGGFSDHLPVFLDLSIE
ncbi:hypothetical protein ACFLTI_04515 [Bacteroidota bacterium]